MKTIPQTYLQAASAWTHALGTPFFFLCFALTYRCEWMRAWIDPTGGWWTFNVLMLSSILLVVMSLSRGGLYWLQRQHRLSVWQYMQWCFAEWIASVFFIALYLTLMNGDAGYFSYVGRSMAIVTSIVAYPYVVINLALSYTTLRETGETPANLLRFYDSTRRLKLVIADDVVLSIKAEENYVNIQYLEGNKIKSYSLRNSMSALEEMLESHGILRCHRSYFVNPAHIRVLRREKEGVVVAELDIDQVTPVPVSSKYYSTLVSRL